MRVSSYYGQTLGVRMVEQRRGKISSMTIGSVDRHPPEGADWTVRYCPTHVVDKPLSMDVIDRQIARCRHLSPELFAEAVDRILNDALGIPAGFPMAFPMVGRAA